MCPFQMFDARKVYALQYKRQATMLQSIESWETSNECDGELGMEKCMRMQR